jgi:hypothetical protein
MTAEHFSSVPYSTEVCERPLPYYRASLVHCCLAAEQSDYLTRLPTLEPAQGAPCKGREENAEELAEGLSAILLGEKVL